MAKERDNRLAIVIPYFKVDFFEDTLMSLASQSNKEFNVYIGDDAGPVPALSLIEKYQDEFNCIYKRFDENLGSVSLVKQWDRCLSLINNEHWIMILGDDDSLSEDCVKDFYDNLTEIEYNDYHLIRFATKLNDVVNKKVSSLFTHPKLERSTDFFFRRLRNETRSSLSEYVFKRNCYEKHGFYNYNLAWYADDRAWFEFSNFAYVYSINSSYLYIGLSEENISRKDYKNDEKQLVALKFYHYLIAKKLNKFNRKQKEQLLLYYEQLVYKSKKTSFQFWVLMFVSFIGCLYFVQSIKFTRRLLIHLNK